MTKQERMRAFEMRVDGANWSQIARALGYSSTAVKNDLLGCISTPPYQPYCAYPAIRKGIVESYGGSIRAFAAACGLTYGAMYYTLSGRNPAPPQRQRIISAVLGIPPETAFAREDDDL